MSPAAFLDHAAQQAEKRYQGFLQMQRGALFGALFASFFVVVYERVPAGRRLSGRSACVCGRQLRIYENLPIVGWLATAGRARCCGVRIPFFYVGAETAAAVIVGLSGALAGFVGIASSILLIGTGTWFVAFKRRTSSRRSANDLSIVTQADQTQPNAGMSNRGAFDSVGDCDLPEREGRR
jgi:hypothetical protein